jgi:hypothetical protein
MVKLWRTEVERELNYEQKKGVEEEPYQNCDCNAVEWYVVLTLEGAMLDRNFGVDTGDAFTVPGSLDTNSAFASWSRRTTENLDLLCRLQDIPYAD